uniref:DNA-binding protein n=1 Tax=Thaumasiovibrio occultus TaxID=1891184 RepID=UPI000B351BCD|nr:DNA-binding protein [Thaumasiovibrio occultus]
MTKQWFTVRELVGLPDMPQTPQGLRKLATRNEWKKQRKSSGKGWEYHLSCLPEQTRAHLSALSTSSEQAKQEAKRALYQSAQSKGNDEPADTITKQREMMLFNNAPKEQQKIVLAKIEVLNAREAYLDTFKSAKRVSEAERQFVERYNRQELPFAKQIYLQVPKISVPTLRRWQNKLDHKGPVGLVANVLRKRKQTKIEQQESLQNFLVAIITQKPHFASKPNRLHELIVESAGNYPEWAVPSPTSISRWLTRWMKENAAAFTYLTNPDAYTSKHRPLYGYMYPWVQAPNDCWELDSTPTDVELQVDGKLKRYSIVAAIDVYTRRVKFILAPTSNSEAICLLLRKCLLEWGMPNEHGVVRTDNGSDYVSNRVTAIFEMLNINTERARAFSGWEKPYIERFFRSLSEGLLELLPGYIGHNVTDRQAIEAAKSFAERISKGKKQLDREAITLACTPKELEQLINDWIDYKYMHTAHNGEGMKGSTPFQKFTAANYTASSISDARSLDYLLNYVGTATVIRGRISKDGIAYTSEDLMNLTWDRKVVKVFIDPTDVGRCVLYRDDQWDCYTEAYNVALVGQSIDPHNLRMARKAQQKELSRFRKSAQTLQKEYGIDTLAAENLAARKAADNLETLALKVQTADNKAIQALSAISARQKQDNPSYTPEQLEQIEQAKKLIDQQQEKINERKGLLIRDEHEKASHLATESTHRLLTEKEEEFLAKYKRNNPFARKRIEEIMARRVSG